MNRTNIVLTAFCLVCSTAIAQRPLTLDECLSVALKQNVSVEIAAKTISATRLAREENGRTVLPQFKVEGRAMHAPYGDHFGYDPAITNRGEYSAQVTAQEQLFDGGARGLKSDQLAASIDRLGVEQHKAERDVKYNVTVSFFDLLRAQEELNMQARRLDVLSEYLDLVNRLYHGGGVNYTDVLKTRVSVDNARLTLQQSGQDVLNSKIALAEAMGIPGDTTISVSGGLEMPDSAAIVSHIIETAPDSAHNLDLQIADMAVKSSLFDVELARTERYPVISLNGDVGVLTSGDNLRQPSGDRSSVFGVSIGVSVENLLFNWGLTDLRIQQQQLTTENLRLQYAQQRRELSAEALRLRTALSSTLQQLRLLRSTLTTADDNFTLTKAQYAGGGIGALEVLSAEQLLAENRLAELQSRADLRKLLARIDQLFEH